MVIKKNNSKIIKIDLGKIAKSIPQAADEEDAVVAIRTHYDPDRDRLNYKFIRGIDGTTVEMKRILTNFMEYRMDDAWRYIKLVCEDNGRSEPKSYYLKGLFLYLGLNGVEIDREEAQKCWDEGRKYHDPLCAMMLYKGLDLRNFFDDAKNFITAEGQTDIFWTYEVANKKYELLKEEWAENNITVSTSKETESGLSFTYESQEAVFAPDVYRYEEQLELCRKLWSWSSENGNWLATYALAKNYYDEIYRDKEKSFELYGMAADKGCTTALIALGDIYIYKESQYFDANKALYCYEQAIKLRDKTASYKKALCYYEGAGVNKDWALALKLCKVAISVTCPEAALLASFIEKAGADGVPKNPEEAFEYCLLAAKWGLGEAKCEVAKDFALGLGVPQSLVDAAEWYQAAADEGLVEGMLGIADALEYGKGVAPDAAKALEWLNKAAETGYGEALCALGTAYYEGRIVSNNDEQAYRLYYEAYKKGSVAAIGRIGDCYRFGRGTGTMKDEQRAIKLYSAGINKGDAYSAKALGMLYYNNHKYVEAVQYFTIAAERGHVPAQYNLAMCYYQGLGAEKNIAKAVEWFTRAAEGNDADAQYRMGMFYTKGVCVEKDLAKALHWFEKAAKNGDANAQYLAARSYFYGEGCRVDMQKAKYYGEMVLNNKNNEKVLVPTKIILENIAES